MDELRDLVVKTLHEFEDLRIDAIARRVQRVALLNDDLIEAARFRLELTQLASDDASKEVAMSVWRVRTPSDLEGFNEMYREGMRRLMVDRKLSSDNLDGRPIDRIEQDVARFEGLLARSIETGDLGGIEIANTHVMDLSRILSNVRGHAYDYLCRVEAQRTVSDPIVRSFNSGRSRVDKLLERYAPHVRDQLASAVRASFAAADDPEMRSHVLLTCRRVMKAVADVVYPAQPEPVLDLTGEERAVGDDQFINRLLAFYGGRAGSTFDESALAAIKLLAARLDSLNSLDNKGVHATVTTDEMPFGLSQTYLLCGEVLALHQRVEDQAPSAT